MSRMLSKKHYFTIAVIALLTINFCLIIRSSGDVTQLTNLSIYVPNSESTTQYGYPVLIRGIWHYVNITLDIEVDKLSIILYYGNSPAVEKDETNYYKWEYNQGSWNDIQHTSKYMEENYCTHEMELYSFFIGIDQYAETGNWTMELSVNDEKLISKKVYVGKAITSLALKSIPVTIMAEPFTEDYYKSEEGFTVENDGNVPLKLLVDYKDYRDILSTINFNEILKPGQTAKYSILLNSRSSWEPGELVIKAGDASVKADVLYIIPPKKAVNLIESNLSLGLPIIIEIGHIGYRLESLGGEITFQYPRSINIYYDEVKEIFVYISGNGDVTININTANLKILNIFSDGVEVEPPFTIRSTNTSEYPIAIRVKGVRVNTTGYIYYDLETSGEHNSFSTTINVGSYRPVEKSEYDITLIIEIIIISCIFIVITYMLYSQIKHKKHKKK